MTIADDSAARRSLMARTMHSVTSLCATRPMLVLVLATLSVVGSVGYTYSRLTFKTDRSDLIDPSLPFHQRWIRYTEGFGAASDIVVVVESSDPAIVRGATDALAETLSAEPNRFRNVLYQVDASRLKRKGLQYLSPVQLEAGLARLEDYRPVLQGRWDLVRLESLIPRLRYQLTNPSRGDLAGTSDALLQHADRLTASMVGFFRDRESFSNPWPDMVPLDPGMELQADRSIYTTNDAGTMGFVNVTPVVDAASFDGAGPAVDRLRALAADVMKQHPGASIELTGIPVLECDEMRRSQSDMGWASVLSYSLVLGLLVFGLRSVAHPLLAMLMLAIGLAWTLAYTTAVVGHLNILSVSFVTILIGLGIDFSVHFISRYLQLRDEGLTVADSLVGTTDAIGVGVATGSLTTTAAFFCTVLTSFLGIAELGWIAAGGILLCVFATFTVLPAMMALLDKNSDRKAMPHPLQLKGLLDFISRFPRATAAMSFAVVVACSWSMIGLKEGKPEFRVRYDHNLLNLQAKGLASVDVQDRIHRETEGSLLFAISLAKSPEEARRLKAQFESLPSVRKVEDLASRLPRAPSQQTKLLIQGYAAQLNWLPKAPPQPKLPASPVGFGRVLEDLHQHLRQRKEPAAIRVAQRIDEFLNAFETWNSIDQIRWLSEFEYRVAYALLAQFQELCNASQPEPVSIADFPAELASRYVSADGLWLLQIFPRKQVWDMEPLSQFVRELRTVDPDVTGTPLQNFEGNLQIKHSYELAGLYSLLIVMLILIVNFLEDASWWSVLGVPLFTIGLTVLALRMRGIHCDFLVMLTALATMSMLMTLFMEPRALLLMLAALAPPIVGLSMTFGLLVLFDVPLNPANLIILPLILGIGVDNGVHVLHDYHGRERSPYRMTPSMVNAIVLCSLTTMAGFGSMAIAAHRGIQSLGIVLTIGVGCSLFVSLFLLPSLLALDSLRFARAKELNELSTTSDDRLEPRQRSAARVA